MWNRCLGISVVLAALPAWGADQGAFKDPVKIEASGKAIDVESPGHAAPFVADFDGDGVRDLLVGQFSGGKLRVYRNEGSNTSPRFADFTWLKDAATGGCVPAG